MVLLFAASFANWSANSFPLYHACAFFQLNSTFHSSPSNSKTLVLICSMRCVCVFWFYSILSVVWLSVHTRTVLSPVFEYCICSSAFRIAICSAWLLVQWLCSLYFNVVVRLFSEKTAIPDPTPASLLLPPVYTVWSVGCFHVLLLF